MWEILTTHKIRARYKRRIKSLTKGSVNVALVDTLAKAHGKDTLAVLEGIEQSHENWVQLKVWRSNAETQLLACNGQLFKCLFMEAAHLSLTAFSNVLNLSVGLLPPIQHTMPPIQPTIVLTTQAPTLGVIPSMGINFSVASGAGDGGDDGSDGSQQADDGPLEDCGTEPEEDPEGGDPGDHEDDVIVVSSPSCRAVQCSVTPPFHQWLGHGCWFIKRWHGCQFIQDRWGR